MSDRDETRGVLQHRHHLVGEKPDRAQRLLKAEIPERELPDEVVRARFLGYVRAQLEEAGANYFVGQFAFGSLSLEETLRSIGLFADEVMPMLKHAARLASV